MMPARAILIAAILAILLGPRPAAAQNITDNLASYTGENGRQYMAPMRDAIGAALNSGLFLTAHVPEDGFRGRLSVRAMIVNLADEDRSFMGRPEDFPVTEPVSVPTVIGALDPVTVEDPASGARFSFPGGFDLGRFGLVGPQLTVGHFLGTEAMFRWLKVKTGELELGDIDLLGLGGRHSISQYFPGLPLHLAAAFMWQRLKTGEDFMTVEATSFGLHASKRFTYLEPYAGFTVDAADLKVEYTSEVSGERIELIYDRETTTHLTLGLSGHAGFFHAHGELNVAKQTGWTFGLGIGML